MGNIVTIIIGVVLMAGGWSGKLVLVGTESSAALIAIGAVLIVWGTLRFIKDRHKK
jgi:hypothetical protein